MERVRASKWVSALAALLLLALTAMPALVRMHCLNSGRTFVSLGQAEGCCSENGHEGKGPVVQGICCELDRTAPERKAFTPSTSCPLPWALAACTTLDPFWVSSRYEAQLNHRLIDRPPPRPMPVRLSFAGSYLL